jgi:hypothetical protein
MTEPGNIRAVRCWITNHRPDYLETFNQLVERTKDPTDHVAGGLLATTLFGFEAGLLQASRMVRKKHVRLSIPTYFLNGLADEIKNYTINSINESEDE